MSQAVHCPDCGKKFGLPDRPPATYPCTACGTVMDLSAFAAPKEAPAAPGTAPAPTSGPGVAGSGTALRSRHRGGRPGSRGGRGQGGGRAPAGRRRGPPPDEPYAPRDKGTPAGLIIAVVVLVSTVFIVIMATRDDEKPVRIPKTDPGEIAKVERIEPLYTAPKEEELDPEAKAKAKKELDAKRKRNARGATIRLSRIKLEIFPWLEDVDEATRAQVDEAIRKMYIGGRDGVEAREFLIAEGRPIAGRLINEFLAIKESPGYDNRGGTSMAMTIDVTLRRMDGWIERGCKETAHISAWGTYASPRFVTKIAKRWTWWWKNEEWKLNPREPWDEREDGSDDTADGMKKPKKKPDPKKGFGKRAGGY